VVVVVVGAVLFGPPNPNILAGELEVVETGVTPKEKVLLLVELVEGRAAAVVVVEAPPAKLKAGAGVELMLTGATVLMEPEN